MSGADDRKAEVSAAQEPQESSICMPCHGTGRVISNLDGHSAKVTCPWCRGGGERLADADAQQWRVEQDRAHV
jgi:DnaJ-class molecular chaperone